MSKRQGDERQGSWVRERPSERQGEAARGEGSWVRELKACVISAVHSI